MPHPNLTIIDKFFEAYGKRDFDSLRKIVDEKITWTFPGRNPFSGTKVGIDAVVEFFDRMGSIMGASNLTHDKLFMESNDDYVVECHHIKTNRNDGNNLDHHWCVLWSFKNGKLIAGKHFAGDQYAVDKFFNAIG